MSAEKDIVCAPDDRLKTECAPIEKIDSSVKALAKRMLKDMYATDGCGLAAPQVGELIQLVVIDVDYSGPEGKNPYVLINPKIIVADGPEREFAEGCLSFPGISVNVKRPSHVIVQAQNLDGDLMQYEARDNLLATRPATTSWPSASSTRSTTCTASRWSTTSRPASAWQPCATTSRPSPPVPTPARPPSSRGSHARRLHGNARLRRPLAACPCRRT